MILYVNESICASVLEKLDIAYESLGTVCVRDFSLVEEEGNRFYLKPDPGMKETLLKVRISMEDNWKLDKFLNSILYLRQPVKISGEKLEMMPLDAEWNGEIPEFAYFKRRIDVDHNLFYSVDEMRECMAKERQLDMCDIYLMIPGKIKRKDSRNIADVWDGIEGEDLDLSDIFEKQIGECIKTEYNNSFYDQLKRKCTGAIALEIEHDAIEGRPFRQTGIVQIVEHETGLCIVEIMVHNCYIGGNKLLNYYCSDALTYCYRGGRYTLDEFLALFSIKRYGNKRSLVFSYGPITKRAIINTLANEEYPMGEIGGIFKTRVEECNVALYDTAEVYVSTATMIECCRKLTEEISFLTEQRIAYHVIEIFFVELLLFQDAAMDKVFHDLLREQEKQYQSHFAIDSIEKFEKINFDMARAIRFSDYDQFVFPTTRESAKRVSVYFGIDAVFEKYEKNKDLLSNMIEANKRRNREKDEAITNRFLMMITFVATVEALGQVIYAIVTDSFHGGISYVSAALLVAGGYFLYQQVMRFYHKKKK